MPKLDGPMPKSRPALASWLSTGNSITQQFMAIGGRPDVVSLAGGLPASEIYPVEAIAAVLTPSSATEAAHR